MSTHRNSRNTRFLITFAAMVLTGCALVLMMPVLFGLFGDPTPWGGWVMGALALAFLGLGWGARRLRPTIPDAQEPRGINRFL